MKSLLKKIRPFIIPIVVTLVVLVLFHSIFMLGYVPTESMEPTLETGSLILGLRIFDELETGDIIIFRRDGSYLVKRIAACAGETIRKTPTTPGTGRIRMYLMRMSLRSC